MYLDYYIVNTVNYFMYSHYCFNNFLDFTTMENFNTINNFN